MTHSYTGSQCVKRNAKVVVPFEKDASSLLISITSKLRGFIVKTYFGIVYNLHYYAPLLSFAKLKVFSAKTHA